MRAGVRAGVRVSWLSLDESDSDPVRFTAYLIAALQTIQAGIGEGLLHFFHMDTGYGFYLQMVLAPQEMVMAFWLIFKGFNPSAITALSAKTQV